MLGLFATKYFQNESENEKRENKLSEIVVNDTFIESLKQIKEIKPKVENEVLIANESQNAVPSEMKIKKFDWPMLRDLPGDEVFKEKTENVLNIIRMNGEARSEILPLASIEVRDWINSLNKDPKLSKAAYKFLLNHEEIKTMDFVVAELIKITKYLYFDKSQVRRVAEESINEGSSEYSNINELKIDEYGSLIKVKESAIFLLDSQKMNRVALESTAKKILQKNKNTLIKNEVLTQLRLNIPMYGVKKL